MHSQYIIFSLTLLGIILYICFSKLLSDLFIKEKEWVALHRLRTVQSMANFMWGSFLTLSILYLGGYI